METNSIKINPLLELCGFLFQLTVAFRTGDRGAKLAEDYGQQLKIALDNMEQSAFAKQITSFEVQQIKYALAAFIDEAILNSAWPKRSSWMGKPLQLQYFGEHSAGEGFFNRLSELRQRGNQYINILEVYYICLQFGFEGMYRMQGLEKLMALQVDLRSQIEMSRGIINARLAPNGLPQQKISLKVGRKLPFWVITSITAALVFCIYLGYSMAISHKANKALQNINFNKMGLWHDK
jgi:type VI secretion system protein ImpK